MNVTLDAVHLEAFLLKQEKVLIRSMENFPNGANIESIMLHCKLSEKTILSMFDKLGFTEINGIFSLKSNTPKLTKQSEFRQCPSANIKMHTYYVKKLRTSSQSNLRTT